MSSYDTGTLSHSNSRNDKPFTGPPPKVTGLSPKEGPPGTKITIRGENLGVSEDDLIGVSICNVDCLIWTEWISDKKIIVRCAGGSYGYSDVIVFTQSGGIGTCTVQFRCIKEIISPTKEYSVWVNEDEHFALYNGTGRHHSSISPILYQEPDPLGLKIVKNGMENETNPCFAQLKLDPSKDRELFRECFPEIEEAIESDTKDVSAFRAWNSPDFHTPLYLLENYQSVRFKHLKEGLAHLHAKNSGISSTEPEKGGPLSLLKPNVLAVIECLDALKAVNQALKQDKQQTGPDLTIRIEESIKRATSEAHDIFDTILSRKDAVDSTRNALNVLQRYRFLFNLPSSIEANIQKGDFEIVINDYIRARSLFADTQVKVFQRVYKEVEARIEKFKVTLNERLITGCKQSQTRNVDEIRKLIKYLMSLEVSGNPGWDCIVAIKDNLRSQMIECRDKHFALLNKPKLVGDDMTEIDQYIEPDSAPQSVQFIEELTLLFNPAFADLVKLSNYYLSGDLYSRESKDKLKGKELILNTEMFQRPIDFLVLLIRSAILPDSVRNQIDAKPWPIDEVTDVYVRWLPYCLRLAIVCYNSLALLDLPCTSMLQNLQQFIFDFRVNSLILVFRQAADEVKGLSARENWDLCLDDYQGTRTQLPLLFEAKVEEILRLVRETILQTSIPDEIDIFTKINVQGQMKQLAQNVLAAFITALENTLDDRRVSSSSSNSNHHADQQRHSSTPTAGSDGSAAVNSTVAYPSIGTIGRTRSTSSSLSMEDRILAVICNCQFTNSNVIPRLQDNLEKYNYPDMNTVIKMVQSRFKDLENKLFQRYVESKCSKVVSPILPSMYINGIEWNKLNVQPTTVSYYVKETIMNIIEVQSEIFSICPVLVRRIMIKVIDQAIEEILRIFGQLVKERLDEYSNLQANLDLAALSYVFDNTENYKSASTARLIHNCKLYVQQLQDSSEKQLVYQLLQQFKDSMQLQMSSFRWNSDQVIIAL